MKPIDPYEQTLADAEMKLEGQPAEEEHPLVTFVTWVATHSPAREVRRTHAGFSREIFYPFPIQTINV